MAIMPDETGYVYNVLFPCSLIVVAYFVFSKIQNLYLKKSCDVSTEEESEFSIPDLEGDKKMVLVVRNDLRMGKGKAASQCSHGAVLAYEIAAKKNRQLLNQWRNSGQRKIVVKVESEEELMTIAKNAMKAGLIYAVVRDAGLTVVEKNTRTVVAVGPGNANLIDQVTGHLKLY